MSKDNSNLLEVSYRLKFIGDKLNGSMERDFRKRSLPHIIKTKVVVERLFVNIIASILWLDRFKEIILKSQCSGP